MVATRVVSHRVCIGRFALTATLAKNIDGALREFNQDDQVFNTKIGLTFASLGGPIAHINLLPDGTNYAAHILVAIRRHRDKNPATIPRIKRMPMTC